MTRKTKTRICGAREQGQICMLNPGHAGSHVGVGAVWGDPKKNAYRRRRTGGKQTRLPF
jgi:hypothetical protein